jgi:hypothetical protein
LITPMAKRREHQPLAGRRARKASLQRIMAREEILEASKKHPAKKRAASK